MTLSTPVIVVPERIQKALGPDGARDLVEVFGQIASSKVGKTDFSAYLSALEAKIEQAKSDLKLEIHRALLKGVVWVIGTVVAVMGIQTAILSYFLGK